MRVICGSGPFVEAELDIEIVLFHLGVKAADVVIESAVVEPLFVLPFGEVRRGVATAHEAEALGGWSEVVFFVDLNDVEVLTYKVGPFGSEFRGAGLTRQFVKPGYTIKMAGDKEGRIQRITIYSPDFKKTYDGFWLKNKELIPWTAKELANWRKMRRETPNKLDAGDGK